MIKLRIPMFKRRHVDCVDRGLMYVADGAEFTGAGIRCRECRRRRFEQGLSGPREQRSWDEASILSELATRCTAQGIEAENRSRSGHETTRRTIQFQRQSRLDGTRGSGRRGQVVSVSDPHRREAIGRYFCKLDAALAFQSRLIFLASDHLCTSVGPS